ncbi:MAG: PDZ domain-containing protein, partial [bacterium]
QKVTIGKRERPDWNRLGPEIENHIEGLRGQDWGGPQGWWPMAPNAPPPPNGPQPPQWGPQPGMPQGPMGPGGPQLRRFESRTPEGQPGFQGWQGQSGPEGWNIGPGAQAFAFNIGQPRLGVQTYDLTDGLRDYFGVKDGGVLVANVVRDSAAAKAGLKAGDVIVKVGGQAIDSQGALIDAVQDAENKVDIQVVRDHKSLTLKADLPDRPKPPEFRRFAPQGDNRSRFNEEPAEENIESLLY